jgi:hypothetical protein
LQPASSHSTNMLRDVIGVVSDTSRAIYRKLSVLEEERDCGAGAPRAFEESRRWIAGKRARRKPPATPAKRARRPKERRSF